MIDQRHKQSFAIILSIVIAVVISIYSLVICETLPNKTSEALLKTLEIIVIAVYVWSIAAWGYSGHRYPCVYIYFLLYAFTSNAGQTLIHIIDPKQTYYYANVYASFGNGVLCQIMAFQAVCIAYMNLGALIGARNGLLRRRNDETIDSPISNSYQKETDISTMFKVVFVIVSLLTIADAISFIFLRTSESYGDAFSMRESASVYVQFAFSALLFFYSFSNSRKKYWRMIVLILTLMALYLISGSRGLTIPLLGCLLVSVYERYPSFFSGKYRIAHIFGLLFIFVLMSAISFIRTESIGSLTIGSVVGENGIWFLLKQSIYEMGMSAMTLGTTISAFNSGLVAHQQTILYQLILVIIPRPVLNMIGITAPLVGSLSAFATGSSTSGAGYSFLAEYFFNFGFVGFLPLMLYGFIITRLEKLAADSLEAGKYIFPSIVYTILCKQVFFARGEFSYIFNYLRITFYIILIWAVFIKRGKISIRYRRPSMQDAKM